MAEKENDRTEPLENEMDGASGQEPNADFPSDGLNNLNQPSAPPAYDEATQPWYEPR